MGLSATTVQISLSSMHHQPESRLAQSRVHFQKRPRCLPNYKLSTVADTIEPALVGSTDTFTIIWWMVPDNKMGDSWQTGTQAPEELGTQTGHH